MPLSRPAARIRGQGAGARERVGPAGRHADDREAAEPEAVGEMLDVGGEVGNTPPGARIRASEARTADRDVVDAERGDERVELRRAAHRRADRAVEVEHGDAAAGPSGRPREPAAVGEGHGGFAGGERGSHDVASM